MISQKDDELFDLIGAISTVIGAAKDEGLAPAAPQAGTDVGEEATAKPA
ncbi:hypothetical protein ACFWMJ_21045 [Streptomyces hawaiiensis]